MGLRPVAWCSSGVRMQQPSAPKIHGMFGERRTRGRTPAQVFIIATAFIAHPISHALSGHSCAGALGFVPWLKAVAGVVWLALGTSGEPPQEGLTSRAEDGGRKGEEKGKGGRKNRPEARKFEIIKTPSSFSLECA